MASTDTSTTSSQISAVPTEEHKRTVDEAFLNKMKGLVERLRLENTTLKKSLDIERSEVRALKARNESTLRNLKTEFKKKEEFLEKQLRAPKDRAVDNAQANENRMVELKKLTIEIQSLKSANKGLQEKLKVAQAAECDRAAELRAQAAKHAALEHAARRDARAQCHKLLEEIKSKERVILQLKREAARTAIIQQNDQISRNGIVCIECFAALQAALQSGAIHTRILGHRNVCFVCGTSILRARSTRVPPDCEERNIIINRIFPHLVSHLERVCRACWMATRRTIQRNAQQDANHSMQDALITEDAEITGHDQEAPIIYIPEPPPFPQVNLYQPQRRQQETKIMSQTYKRAAVTTRHCIFPACENMERLLVPRVIKEEVLSRHRIYIPPSARICNFHLYNDCWDQLQVNYSDFTGTQMDNLLAMLERMSMNKIDFSNVHMIPPNLCHYWLGMNATQFYELMDNIPQLHEEVPDASVALSIYLTKLRSGDSNERLTGLFNMPRSTLERNMNKARDILTEYLVPRYLGLSHMTVQEVAATNTVIPEGFYGNRTMPDETKPAITICDATYVYIQSSSNYLFQKQTYSLHKYTNLVKPFMIVCCNGHILDCLGPYKATTNDATIMSAEFRRSDGALRTYFREGDVFILDRGFRDVVAELQEYGYQTHMPESLLEGHHQLTTDQANRSRCVTMCRWVVEVVNGRIKQDFKLFRQEFFNRAAKHLMEDFRIGCALINKFRPIIEDKPEYSEYLEIARQRLSVPNLLADIVEVEHLNRRRTGFINIEGHHFHLNQFPRLEIEDLKRLALGTYQLKQARSYYGEHIRQNGTYTIQINDSIEDDIPLVLGLNNYIIRGRIKSRHVSSRTYYTYLLINRNEDTANTLRAISGYCCSCLVGRRTVGCCAHVMTITWYLSWGRHNDVSAPAPFLDDIFEEYVYENIE